MNAPIRILHILNEMERGGIAAWLMTVLRHIDRDRFQMDFLVHTSWKCSYDDEATDLGARIIRCPRFRNPFIYSRQFMGILQSGSYHVVHGHCHRFTGLNLFLASRAGVPVRIAHSHNDTRSLASGRGFLRRKYYDLMDRLIDRYATVGLSASRLAAEDLFGPQWHDESRWRILFCGIDFSPFHAVHDRRRLLSELGLPQDVKVIGHVGRFIHQKNHPFTVELFYEALKLDPNLRLVLVGDGDLEDVTKQHVQQLGLGEKVQFLGSRPDVPRLLLAGIDLFLFPSLYEGLGLALVEAQAAGVPCLVSEFIPEEADAVPALVRRLSLSEPAAVWAEQAVEMLGRERPISQADALSMVEKSHFNILSSIGELQSVYARTVMA